MEVAASIVGLLTAGTKLSQFLEQLIKSTVNAPSLAQDINDEIQDFTFVLARLHPLLAGSASHDPSDAPSMAGDGQLASVVARSRATIQELDDQVPRLADGDEMDMRDRLRWVWAEPTLTPLLQRLQRHKKSLNLILTTLIYETSLNRTRAQAHIENSPELDLPAEPHLYRLAFEQSLLTTGPYRRVRINRLSTENSDLSWTSFDRPIPRWSFMSGATDMCVRSLPLSPSDSPRYGTPPVMPDDAVVPELLLRPGSVPVNAGRTTPELRVDAEYAQDERRLETSADTDDGKPPAEEQSPSYLTVPQTHTTAVRGAPLPPVPGLIRRNCMRFD